MAKARIGRRDFLSGITGAAAALPVLSPDAFPLERAGTRVRIGEARQTAAPQTRQAKLRFAVIGVNHGHINGQSTAVIRASGFAIYVLL